MWAFILYLMHTPHSFLMRHVRARKSQLLQAANVWTAFDDISYLLQPMNYCRLSMCCAGDYDGIAVEQSGISRWEQEQRRILGCEAFKVAKQDCES